MQGAYALVQDLSNTLLTDWFIEKFGKERSNRIHLISLVLQFGRNH